LEKKVRIERNVGPEKMDREGWGILCRKWTKKKEDEMKLWEIRLRKKRGTSLSLTLGLGGYTPPGRILLYTRY
jgi:hypothetical protein